jgi:hypothetical protein
MISDGIKTPRASQEWGERSEGIGPGFGAVGLEASRAEV